MDEQLFLRSLRSLSLEEGKNYLQEHIEELSDNAAISALLEYEALDQLYTNPSVSLKFADLLIFWSACTGYKPAHALGLKAKGDVFRAIGLHQAALDCLDAAGEAFLQLGREGDWGRSRVSWILACAWLGQVEEALQEAERARETFVRIGEDYWACIIDHNTAWILQQVGRYQEALDLYKRMLTIYPTLKDQSEIFIKRAIAMAKVNYSITLAWVGEFEQAYQLEQEAQAAFRQLGETSMVINSEINLANLDYTLGYYGSALRRYYQARESIVEQSIDPGLLLAEINLWAAKCLGKLSRIEEASELANRAIEIYRGTEFSLSTAEALQEYAVTLIAAGRLKEAMASLDEARILFERGNFEHHAAAARLQQADLLLELQEFNRTYDEATTVKHYFDAKGLQTRSVRASLIQVSALVGMVHTGGFGQEAERRHALLHEALALCKRNALLARRCHLQEEVYKSQYLLGTIGLLQGNALKANKHFEAAIVQIERMLSNLAYDLSPAFLRTAWAVYEDMITLCLEQSRFNHAFGYLERARSLALQQYLNKSQAIREKQDGGVNPAVLANKALLSRTQQELERWQNEYHRYSMLLANDDTLALSDEDRAVIQREQMFCEGKVSELFERLHLHQIEAPAFVSAKRRARGSRTMIDTTWLCQQLAPGQMMLAYCLCKSALVIFTLTTDGFTAHTIVDGAAQIDYLLSVFQIRLFSSAQHNQQNIVIRLLKKLYNLLIAPVADLLPPPSGSLIIVPHGPLHELPFHAFHDGSGYLIERFQISYLPASSILTWLQQHNGKISQGSKEAIVRPLILGYSGKEKLRRALEEATIVADMLGGHCYLEQDATIVQLVAQATGCPLIHIATHGKIRWDAPNFSSVLLADGQLNAIDAFNMDLHACELVTLSGCETGLAQIGGGDEQIGLGRAFLAAGASSLLISLWPVEDNATSVLMQLFYRYLRQGESKVRALHLAQCDLIRQTPPRYDHPYFWASFRLVGDTGPLEYLHVEP
jgi:CHAT domain-containing protein